MTDKAKKKAKKPTLHIRKIPPELVGRVNAAAGFLEMDRDEFVTKLLSKLLARLEPMQKEIKDRWKALQEWKDIT